MKIDLFCRQLELIADRHLHEGVGMVNINKVNEMAPLIQAFIRCQTIGYDIQVQADLHNFITKDLYFEGNNELFKWNNEISGKKSKQNILQYLLSFL